MNECIFDIDPKLLALASEAENECREMFEKIDSNAEYNGQKVLKAFIDNRVSEGCLKGTTGYGYGDMGRDTIDKVFAQALGGDDALVRHTFVNGFLCYLVIIRVHLVHQVYLLILYTEINK